MQSKRYQHKILFLWAILSLHIAPLQAQSIPKDLIDDEHVREEFGVNQFTTPSIRKIFDSLEKLKPLPYDKIKREIREKPVGDQVQISLTLGVLLSDLYLVVEAEKVSELKRVIKAIEAHSKALGIGERMEKQFKHILQSSAIFSKEKMKKELSGTQVDIEAEMFALRNEDMVHLVGLGGWVRSIEIGSVAIVADYSPEKVKEIARLDVVNYFLAELGNLDPQIKKNKRIQGLISELEKLQLMVDMPPEREYSKGEVEEMRKVSSRLVDLVLTRKLD